MGVYKVGERYRAEVYVRSRNVASQMFTLQRDALKWHRETKEAMEGGRTVADHKATMDDLLDRFENFHMRSISPGASSRYETEIRLRIRPFFRYMRLSKLTPSTLEEFKRHLGDTVTPVGANYCLETLRTILNRAKKWKLLRESPYELELFPEPDTVYQWWQEKIHIARFLDVARERTKYFPLYLLALETGMRYGELVGLKREDVDLFSGRIHVQRSWDYKAAKEDAPKHGKKRFLDFDPKGLLAQSLRDSLRRSRCELVFPSTTGRHLTYSKVAQKSFYAVIERAQVPELSFHDLRHTFASWYMIQHDDIWSLSALLGHASIETTMRYAHHGAKQRRKPLGLSELLSTQNPRVIHTSESVRA